MYSKERYIVVMQGKRPDDRLNSSSSVLPVNELDIMHAPVAIFICNSVKDPRSRTCVGPSRACVEINHSYQNEQLLVPHVVYS